MGENIKYADGAQTDAERQKVAIYVRVSTTMQADRDSLPMQRQDLESYCRLILGIDDYVFFEDAGYSGKNTDRPAYQEMMARVRRGEFSHILVWKIDRISRNLLDFAEMYDELQRLRVTFVSKNEQFDTSTAIGEAMLKIILVFAELERNMTSERVTATMISRASNGSWNGGRIPFGYDYDKESGLFSINESEARICVEMKDDYLRRHSLSLTSRLLNEKGYRQRSGSEWSPATVWIVLSNPFYTGTYRYNRYKGTENRTENPPAEWVMVPNHHPAIFTQEEYDRMAQIRSENNTQKNSPGKQCSRKNVHVFTGLVFCAKCGSKYTSTPGRVQADGYRTTVYSCPERRKTHNCDNASVNDLVIGEFVLNYVLNMLNAKRSFSEIADPAALESRLLFGQAFDAVQHIGSDGLNAFFNLLSCYRSDNSYTLSASRPKRKRATVDPEIDKLKRERAKQERALRRLEDLYLYSSESMSEKDFMIRKQKIVSEIESINKDLGLRSAEPETVLSDEEFIRQASHLLIAKELEGRSYIYYKNLAQSVSPDVLREYVVTIIDAIYVRDGKVVSIMFKNGLKHDFQYADD